jgi:antitoxin (DNA-binding transcriptional repressor) of toxin-antitoxin stability system
MRELSRNTKSVIEDVVRSGRPAIITINGRPQVAITPIVGAMEAAEEQVLSNAPAHIQAAIREGEADLIGGRVSLVDDSAFADLGDEPGPGPELLTTLADQLDTRRLEDAIRSSSKTTDGVAEVREALMDSDIFALGSAAGDASGPGSSTESNIVTYPNDREPDNAGVLMPVFTRVDVLREALIRNPSWQSLAVLRLSGKELVLNVDPDVTIVIDPWSDREFRVPHTGHRPLLTEQAVVSAAELVAAGA